MRISCLEIYHEHVYDLCVKESERQSLNVREHISYGFFADGCKLIPCKNSFEAIHCIDTALKHRQIGGHDLNIRSNRSHCITDVFVDVLEKESPEEINSIEKTVPVIAADATLDDLSRSVMSETQLENKESSEIASSSKEVHSPPNGSNNESKDEADQETCANIETCAQSNNIDSFGGSASGSDTSASTQRINKKLDMKLSGRLTLIDLAGSERLKSTNSSGKVLQEAGFINRSLYVLGKVISGLVRTGGVRTLGEVPFRDSKLTKLLIESLGGSSRTMLIACVTEASGSLQETLRTLTFRYCCQSFLFTSKQSFGLPILSH